ncbi:MAG: asparagine synthase (glutamine-hydrolyzing) [Bacteroidota bacterium]|nr:asparagine synthase (glutamine-hydrolyzing) [Candidatus Kapabacteria bacterium]MDW8220549.1 asparagine synthase (glutamine-hydrolyzing) [Bacteroidota bacterium]
MSEEVLKRMSDVMAHRGPDDEGQWIAQDRRAGFAFRRLAIIDLSANGHQPMTTPDERLTIVFNGEIYNHRALRCELEALGYRYRSETDTETILYGFVEWGEHLLHKMVGMWGFAIWDSHSKELFAARDRIGIKPLYYTHQGGRFLFASEIKALLQHKSVTPELNIDELPNYFCYSMTGSSTLFQGIQKLAPGHYLRLKKDGTLIIQEYWNPLVGYESYPEHVQEHLSQAQRGDTSLVEREILRLLRQAVRDRMMSDVPFGVFLSGGIDSSVNVALMAELMDRPVDTFSVGFKKCEKYNEMHYARRVSALFKTHHHEILIDEQDALEVMERLAWHEDEPNGDPVCIPLNFVSKIAREHGTIVVQVGEGSDEQFAGYAWMHRELRFYNSWWKWFTMLPVSIRKLAFAVAQPLAYGQGQYLALDYLRRAVERTTLYRGGGVDITAVLQKRLFGSRFRALANTSDNLAERIDAELLSRKPDVDFLMHMVWFEFRHRLPELLLMRVDKITMAHGVEARVPFLDHRLVEYTMMLPQSVKVPRLVHEGGETKHLLKRTVRAILPHDIIYRPKQGFAAPVNEWFRSSLRRYWEHEVLGSRLVTDGILDNIMLQELMQRHMRARHTNYGKSLYALLNLALWYKQYIS